MTVFSESYNDGYISYVGGSFSSVNNYFNVGSGIYVVIPQFYDGDGVYTFDVESRAYKRFALGLDSGVTVNSAILYWYLYSIPYNSAQKSCNLEQINDYSSLDSGDWNITVKKNYGSVMAYNAVPGWKTQDVTAQIAASKTDPYVAFRWRVLPFTTLGWQQFYIGAYEWVAGRARLKINITYPYKSLRVGGLTLGSAYQTITLDSSFVSHQLNYSVERQSVYVSGKYNTTTLRTYEVGKDDYTASVRRDIPITSGNDFNVGVVSVEEP